MTVTILSDTCRNKMNLIKVRHNCIIFSNNTREQSTIFATWDHPNVWLNNIYYDMLAIVLLRQYQRNWKLFSFPLRKCLINIYRCSCLFMKNMYLNTYYEMIGIHNGEPTLYQTDSISPLITTTQSATQRLPRERSIYYPWPDYCSAALFWTPLLQLWTDKRTSGLTQKFHKK